MNFYCCALFFGRTDRFRIRANKETVLYRWRCRFQYVALHFAHVLELHFIFSSPLAYIHAHALISCFALFHAQVRVSVYLALHDRFLNLSQFFFDYRLLIMKLFAMPQDKFTVSITFVLQNKAANNGIRIDQSFASNCLHSISRR